MTHSPSHALSLSLSPPPHTGGSIVTTPLMLELHLHPQVAGATSHAMLVLTTVSASIVYAQMGYMIWSYVAVMAVICFFCTYAGQVAADQAVRRSGRASYLAFLVAFLLAVSAALSLYIGVQLIIKERRAGTVGRMGHLCSTAATHFAQAVKAVQEDQVASSARG